MSTAFSSLIRLRASDISVNPGAGFDIRVATSGEFTDLPCPSTILMAAFPPSLIAARGQKLIIRPAIF
jgi:hypothetical protein